MHDTYIRVCTQKAIVGFPKKILPSYFNMYYSFISIAPLSPKPIWSLRKGHKSLKDLEGIRSKRNLTRH